MGVSLNQNKYGFILTLARTFSHLHRGHLPLGTYPLNLKKMKSKNLYTAAGNMLTEMKSILKEIESEVNHMANLRAMNNRDFLKHLKTCEKCS